MSDWLDSFREETERIRLETEEIKKETERLREENRKLRALSPEKLDEIVKKSTIMTEPDYKQILKNQDLISNLSIEEVENLERLLFTRKNELKEKRPEYHILDNPDNIKVSKRKVVDDLVPRVEYTISVNQEAVTDHKNLWRKWYINNVHRTEENVDGFMDEEILRWIEEKLEKVMRTPE